MKSLIKKEFLLSLHPTMFIFLCMPLLLFVPNYPYEVIFFFSGLATFFYFQQTRENKDIAFSCELPILKSQIPVAKIVAVSIFQLITLLLTLFVGLLKQALLPNNIINYAGLSANISLIGCGGVLLGIFNLIFFPMLFKNPNKIGIPFVVAAIVQFIVIAIIITLRFTTNLFGTMLNGLNTQYLPIKLSFVAMGLAIYVIGTIISIVISKNKFIKFDI